MFKGFQNTAKGRMFEGFPRNIFGISSEQLYRQGMIFWYDSKNVELSGTSVTKMYDLSGNAYDAVQGTAINQPQINLASFNGLNTVLFDGTDDFLKCNFGTSYAQPNTYYAIFKTTKSTSFQWLFDGYDATRTQIYLYNNLIYYGTGTTSSYAKTLPFGFSLFSFIMNTTSSSAYLEQVSVSSGANCGTGALTGITIGARYCIAGGIYYGLQGELVCLLCYAGAHSTALRTQIENSLKAIYG